MSTYRQYHDQLMHVFEELEREPIDPATKLVWTRDLALTLWHEAVRLRNKAAYELRQTHNTHHAESATGISRDKITAWVVAHRKRTGAPAIPHKRQDMSGAKKINAGVGFPSQHPH